MFATIYLPNFYLQAALRYRTELRTKPAALIEEREKKPVIIQLNTAAQSAGVRKGMTPSQALARCLEVLIRVRAREQEKSVRDILLHYAFSLSPFVEATAPGIATIQFTDSRNLSDKVGRIIEHLAESELHAQAGLADNPDTSFLAAHLARPLLEVNDTRKFLAPLSIDVLASVM